MTWPCKESSILIMNHIQLQNAVSTFMNNRLLQFNATKCKFMFVSSRSLLPPALHLNGTLLEQVPISGPHLLLISPGTHILLPFVKNRKTRSTLSEVLNQYIYTSTLLKLLCEATHGICIRSKIDIENLDKDLP